MEFPLSVNAIQELKAMGFKINWMLLKIGYEGDEFLPQFLSMDSVYQYAKEQLIEGIDSNEELVVRLIIDVEDESGDDYNFLRALERLIATECANQSVQKRKWRAYLVKRELSTIPDDYLNGLLALTSLWISLGLPDDCPHIIQGRNNLYTPRKYYTQKVFDVLLEKNKQWLKDEIEYIKSLESTPP